MIKEARGFGSTIDEARENAILNLKLAEVELINEVKKETPILNHHT